MSSFFIRDGNVKSNTKTKKRKGKVYYNKNDKSQKRIKKPKEQINDEEISSDEDEVYRHKNDVETDEDEYLTAQEKKVKLAKEYLKDIEKEEKERLETEELDNDVILGRLNEEVLSQAGKLKKSVSDKILTEYRPEEFHILKCKQHKRPITCLVVSNNNYLYTGSKDHIIVKWSLVTMSLEGFIPPRRKHKDNETLPDSPIASLAISNDNKYLASCDNSKDIQLWDAGNLSHVFTFKGHTAAVTGLAFCRFSLNLYSCSKDRTVKVWSVQDKAYLETLFGHHMPITGIDSLTKDRAITSGGTDDTVRVWKIQEESQLIFNHTRSIDGVKRLDDHHFISFGDDGSVCIWAVTKKKPLHIIKEAHGKDNIAKVPQWITSVACISNSEVFASGSCDGTVKIWKCEENFRKTSLIANVPIVGFANAMAFTKDFKKLIIGVGQEHKLGRFSKIKEAKNCIVVVHVKKLEE
ncbi:hypothetical protein O3M35_006225 [Rhynocoris fuscipes]